MSLLSNAVFAGYITLAVLVVILKLAGTTGVELVLAGLRSFYCVDPSSRVPQPTAAELRTKKGRKLYAKQQLAIKGQELQIYQQGLGQNALRSLLFSDDISALVTLALCLLANAGLVFGSAVLTGTYNSNWIVPVSVSLVIYCTYCLVKVDSVGQSTGMERSAIMLITLIGITVSMFSLMSLPDVRAHHGGLAFAPNSTEGLPMVDWHLADAARGLDLVISSLTERAGKRLAAVQEYMGAKDVPSIDPSKVGRVEPWALALAASVWAGLLAAAMLGPAIRYAKLMHNAMNVPAWGEEWIGHRWLAVKVMQLGFALPLVMVLLVIQPVSSRWGLSADALTTVGPVVLVLIALAHVLAFRHLSQAYLDYGLIDWHTLSHNDFKVENKQAKITMRLNIHRALLGKAAVQLLTPSLMACSLGLLLLTSGGAMDKVVSHSTDVRAAFHEKLPPALLPYFNRSITEPAQPIVEAPAPAEPPAAPIAGDASDDSASSEPQIELEGMGDEDSKPAPTKDVQEVKAAVGSRSKTRSQGPASTEHLWLFFGQYLGWWCCAVWCLYAYCTMLVQRLGLDQSS
mmetsp:Transcript_36734/g.92787  ORF Transcript_36734/g.92787 Transcript_36734/m.92787 type:complete len:571 (-) Transcript_36734:505-2217(-)